MTDHQHPQDVRDEAEPKTALDVLYREAQSWAKHFAPCVEDDNNWYRGESSIDGKDAAEIGELFAETVRLLPILKAALAKAAEFGFALGDTPTPDVRDEVTIRDRGEWFDKGYREGRRLASSSPAVDVPRWVDSLRIYRHVSGEWSAELYGGDATTDSGEGYGFTLAAAIADASKEKP